MREAAVVGAADEIRGEIPIAYIVGEFDGDALTRLCGEQLASFKVPRRFVRVESIPRTALGKVQKHLLRVHLAVDEDRSDQQLLDSADLPSGGCLPPRFALNDRGSDVVGMIGIFQRRLIAIVFLQDDHRDFLIAASRLRCRRYTR